jgi:hypothetical protein
MNGAGPQWRVPIRSNDLSIVMPALVAGIHAFLASVTVPLTLLARADEAIERGGRDQPPDQICCDAGHRYSPGFPAGCLQ